MKIVALVLAVLTLLAGACGPKCLKGHEEWRHQEGRLVSEVFMHIPVGDISVPIYHTVYHPPYDYQVFVCDQYEVEKP